MTPHRIFNLPYRDTAEIEIDVPIDEVFSYVTDPHNHVYWHQVVSDVHDVSEPTGVGQRFTWTAHYLGKRVESTQEVTDFEPNTLYALQSVTGPYHGAHHFQFEPRDNGTWVTVTLAVEDLDFLAKLAEPLIQRAAHRAQQHSLETLKDLLETHGPDHPR